MVSKRLIVPLLCLLLVPGLTGCERAPSGDSLRSEVGGLLEKDFKAELFEIESLRRLGSSKFGVKETADRQMTVYFNLQLRLREAIDLTRWDGLNAASLAYLLGATEKGVEGIRPDGNAAGDILRIRGSRMYALRQGQWRPLPVPPAKQAGASKAAETQRILDRIAELAERSSKRFGGTEQAIVEGALQDAVKKIERELDQQAQVFSAAGGPASGAYSRYIEALERNPRSLGFHVRNYSTQGSVENCQLVHAGSVDIAIAQSNITALAREGKDIFRGKPPLEKLRAITALFPEYVQIVVAANAGIDRIQDLRGKRVDLGLPASGSRVDALRILEAAGLRPTDFSETSEAGLNEAVKALQEGRLDGFFVTLQAPGLALQPLLSSRKARLLGIPENVLGLVRESHSGYREVTLPANTYPGQEPVQTLGLIATLIANADLSDQRVEQLLEGLFKSVDRLSRHNLRISLLSPESAREGLTVPLHPAAERYFSKLTGEAQKGGAGSP